MDAQALHSGRTRGSRRTGSTGRCACEDVAACHRHDSCCPGGCAGKACVGEGDVGAGEDGALERRSREGHSLFDPPRRATRVTAGHRQAGGREGAGASSPDFEAPGTRAGEREGSRQRRRRGETVGTWPEAHSGERAGFDGAREQILSDRVVIVDGGKARNAWTLGSRTVRAVARVQRSEEEEERDQEEGDCAYQPDRPPKDQAPSHPDDSSPIPLRRSALCAYFCERINVDGTCIVGINTDTLQPFLRAALAKLLCLPGGASHGRAGAFRIRKRSHAAAVSGRFTEMRCLVHDIDVVGLLDAPAGQTCDARSLVSYRRLLRSHVATASARVEKPYS